MSGFWQSLYRMAPVLSDLVEWLSSQSFEPDDQGLFQVESECIVRIAEHGSGIFLGRCGRYVLRSHRCLFNILHADPADRVHRAQQLFCLETGDAKELIAKNDRDRAAYMRTFAREDWQRHHVESLLARKTVSR